MCGRIGKLVLQKLRELSIIVRSLDLSLTIALTTIIRVSRNEMNASCDIASDDAGESVTYRYASAKGQEKRNQGITRKNLMMIWMEA